MAASLQIGLVRGVEGGEVRIRTIKPEFFKHDKLGELPAMARLLFVSLWCLADRRGRLEDRPKRIKVECLPYDDCDVDALLKILHDAGFICRYEAESVRVIEIESFEKHQRITGKEADTESELPGKQRGNTREATGATPDAQERKGKERKGIAGTEVEAIYQLYPKKVAKAEALKAIEKALRATTFDVLKEAVSAFATSKRGDNPKFIPHPATWFNAQRWLDDRSEWSTWQEPTQGARAIPVAFTPGEMTPEMLEDARRF